MTPMSLASARVAEQHMPRLTEPQVAMMLRAVLGSTRWGAGFGPFGVDLRTYDALRRRGLLVEAAVDRGFGLGSGVIATATGRGCLALAAHLRDHDHGPVAGAWLDEYRPAR